MTYSPVPEVEPGDLWTATQHNTYIKDNFAAGVPDIFTTKGDLAVASAQDVAGRLGVGTNGQALIADSSETLGVKWGTPTFLDYRQGGSATDWTTAGTGTFSPATPAYFQVGTKHWTGSANNNGNLMVELPQAYTYKPLAFGNSQTNPLDILVNVTVVSGSHIQISWRSVAGSTYTNQDLNWITIGE